MKGTVGIGNGIGDTRIGDLEPAVRVLDAFVEANAPRGLSPDRADGEWRLFEADGTQVWPRKRTFV